MTESNLQLILMAALAGLLVFGVHVFIRVHTNDVELGHDLIEAIKDHFRMESR